MAKAGAEDPDMRVVCINLLDERVEFRDPGLLVVCGRGWE